MKLSVWTIALFGVGLLVCGARPPSAHAQVVTGVVREADSGAPVAGALVRLETTASPPETLGSFLTAPDGRYRLPVEAPGIYYLAVERIGFETTRVGPMELEVGRSGVRDLTVRHEPIELEGLSVEGTERQCDLRDAGSGTTQVVWSQVRTALDAATLTAREGDLTFHLRRWERRLSPGDLTIIDEARQTRLARGGNSVRSLPADDLARGGYVRAAPDGTIEYFAPDAEVLLSDDFLDGHCFSVRAGQGESEEGLVGLAFEPLPGRDTTDVRGTIWVERQTGRLERVEFSFVGLSYEVGTHLAGGSVHYARLPDGRWVVERWQIQAPAVVLVERGSPFGARTRQMVDAVHATGAEIVSVRGTGFEWSPDRPAGGLDGTGHDSTTSVTQEDDRAPEDERARTAGESAAVVPVDEGRVVLTGVVRDASNDRPLPAASVALVDTSGGTHGRAVTDSAGAFRLPMEPGTSAHLHVTSVGYRAVERDLPRPGVGRTHRIEVALSPEATEVEGVVVTVEGIRPALARVGFYDRMQRTSGTFLDREQLGLESVTRVSDALQRVPGIGRYDLASRTLDTTRRFIQFRAASRVTSGGPDCMPAIYVDGALVRWGGALTSQNQADYPTLDDLVATADIEAVELYDSPTSLPPRFMGPGTLCGAIVVWTRR